jgi:pyruvate dehydrogenase E2 component (dihydrolipoamide acetyltransferase)
MSSGARRGAVRIEGQDIAFVRSGTGDRTIVLVHGFGADRTSWMFNQAALSAGATVYALDLPGHGASDPDVGDGSLDVLGGAVRGFLAGSGLARVHLVGHSLGGGAALRAALDAPDLVGALTLIAPIGFGAGIDRSFVDGLLSMTDRDEAMRVLRLLVARPELIGPQMADGLLAQKSAPGAEEALRRIAARLFPEGRQQVSLRDGVGTLPMPVQVVWGEADRVLPVEQARGLSDAVPVHLIPNAGHVPQMEAAREVNRLVEALSPASRR